VCVRARARARAIQVVTVKNEISLPDAIARLVIGGACSALGADVTFKSSIELSTFQCNN
jgi:hypothetical protein